MDSKFEFTDKTQKSISDAFQLAKDYGNAQGIFLAQLSYSTPYIPQFSAPGPYCVRIDQ